MSERRPTARRPDIQGLRAVAVVLVIASHAGFSRFGGGFVGVDVFFVLSGYLITSLLLREVDRTGEVSLWDFYARRARRILPAATVVLVVVIVATAFTASTDRLTSVVHDAGWSSVFLANVHFAHVGTNYFADQTPSPFQHFWSLAVEEQFYLVWPLLLLLLAPRIRRRALAWVMAALALGSLIYSIHLTAVDPTAAYFSSPARAYELAAGAVLAAASIRGGSLRAPYGFLVGFAGLTAVIVASIVLKANAPFPGWQALIPVLGTVALLAAGTGRQVGVNRLLGVQPLRYLGDISYSLYLWHWPILQLGAGHAPRLVLLLITLAVSAASYHWIEQPFQRRRVPVLSHGHRSLALWPVALSSVLVVASACDVYASHQTQDARNAAAQWFDDHPAVSAASITPDPGARTPAVASINKAIGAAVKLAGEGAPIPASLDAHGLPNNNWHTKFKCAAGYGDTTTRICAYGDPSASTVVAVVGDSHAGHWLPALDALGKSEHFKLVPVIKVGCSSYDVDQYYSQMPQAECSAFRSWSRRELAHLHPDVIISSSRNELWMQPKPGATVDQQWSTGVRSAVKTLRTLAPVVKVFSDIPHRADAADCLTQPHNRQANCMTTTAIQGAASNPITKSAAQAAGAQWVDILPLVCHANTCPEVVGNLPVYYDDSHLSLSWAIHVAPGLGELLGNLTKD
jgi:peptidoglycan/LPS O-acetylase OafA/YrhL